VVQVLRSVYDAMVAHALDERPNECCGLLSGANGVISRHYRAANVAENQRVRYEAAPLDIARILNEIEDRREEHLGIYHSHPRSEARPSATDRRLAAYDVWYFVVSLQHPDEPEVRAFWLEKEHPADEDAVVREEPIEIVERVPNRR
jgi:[CysO sulfur-carrier protein]-S-L-cysteine hydrolase